MAMIVPIRGVRYHPELAEKMADLVTPPYDVIDDNAQQRYYGKNPYNVIRLEYGEIRQSDDEYDNRYSRAGGFFTAWLRQNVLVHEEKPSFYLYDQEFTAAGKRMTRSGLMAGVGVEDYSSGIILPHEETLSKAKVDRLELLRHCRANFSPIFGLYDDPAREIEEIAARYKNRTADLSFTDEAGECHRVWILSAPDHAAKIQEVFARKKIFIADGHHRYETALNYHREMLAAGHTQYGFTLMTLVNLHDPGLVIFPTHRMIKNVAGFSAENLLKRLAAIFSVSEVPLPAAGRAEKLAAELRDMGAITAKRHAFLLYLGNSRLYRLSMPRDSESNYMQKHYASCSKAWRQLDVAVLQGLVLENLLGINREVLAGGGNVVYTRDEAGALDRIDSGEGQAVFFLNPTGVGEVIAAAGAGDRMPQKSTYFYPKLITGLVINDFTFK